MDASKFLTSQSYFENFTSTFLFSQSLFENFASYSFFQLISHGTITFTTGDQDDAVIRYQIRESANFILSFLLTEFSHFTRSTITNT
jgi:hypothetical protein